MTIRTEQTLRRMWEESAKLKAESERLYSEHKAAADQAAQHDRAAAAEAAAAHACRTDAAAALDVGQRAEAEAADLIDMVNRERKDAGLAPLTPGEPYPVDPSIPVAGATVNGHDGGQS